MNNQQTPLGIYKRNRNSFCPALEWPGNLLTRYYCCLYYEKERVRRSIVLLR